VVGVAYRVLFFSAEESFESEKDVPALPIPVEPVEIGIERILGRDFRDVSVIGFGVRPEIKAKSAIGVGRNIVKNELEAMFFGITPGILVWEFYPSAAFFF